MAAVLVMLRADRPHVSPSRLFRHSEASNERRLMKVSDGYSVKESPSKGTEMRAVPDIAT